MIKNLTKNGLKKLPKKKKSALKTLLNEKNLLLAH